VLYAGQYQPDEMAFLDRAETPSFVAVTGKARTFQPDDSEAVYTSVRPESISTVDAATRDRWTVQTVEQTLERIGHAAAALSLDLDGEALTERLREDGVPDGLAHGIALALDHYGTTPTYLAALRETALDAARLVSGDIDEVESHTTAPDAPGDAEPGALTDATGVTARTDDGTGAETTTGGSESATPEPEETTGGAADANAEGTGAPEDDPTADGDSTDDVSTGDEPTDTESDEPSQPVSANTTVESETEPVTDDIGTGGLETGDGDADDDLGDFDPGEFELDDDEREEIEDEYGTEFQSGADVPEPGEADIDTPDPEPPMDTDEADADDVSEPSTATPGTEPTADDEPTESGEPESTPTAETEPTPESAEGDDETGDQTADVDIDAAVIDVMEDLDDGDGASRTTLVETVTERYGVTEDEVDDAIQDALMSGRCYEPDEATLKSI
jgi:hypothetical protein